MKKQYLLILTAVLIIFISSCKEETTFKTLIITGQNNHNWQASSPVLKLILENTGMFSAEILQTPEKGGDMNAFDPDFSKYKLVVVDYNGDSWSDKTNEGFLSFVRNGGGVVIYHAANNSFQGWKEYNEITGLGGWGDRNEKDGPYIYYHKNELIIDTTAGPGGSHGQRREFVVRKRADHPITSGLPDRWLHGNDELYSQLRGPGKNMTILATAFADSSLGGGTMRDEPILMVLNYEKGRIFHTAMGHAEENGGPAMQCAGFITTLQRGAEWAVTGDVTQPVPYDFPSVAGVVLRPDFKEPSLDDVLGRIESYDIAKSTKNLAYLQNYLRRLAGDEKSLLDIEKKIIKVLNNNEATIDSKKMLLRELSWFGSDYSMDAVKKLVSDNNLKDEAAFALSRLQSEK